MRWLAAFAMSVSLLPAQAGREPLRSVTAVRYWTLTDATRVAVTVSGSFAFRTARLHHPERIYFDILNSAPRFHAGSVYTETLEDPLLSRIHVAPNQADVTRVVLDLAEGTDISTSRLVNPDRLMIELRPPGAPAAPVETASHAKTIVRPALPQLSVGPPMAVPPIEIPPPRKAPAIPDAGVPKPVEVAKAAKRTSAGDSSLVRALGLKLTRVVIDPGHGGHDQGTAGPHGLLEKDLVLDVAQRLGALIEERMGADVIYTRSDDTFLPLQARTALANEKKADLFLSIHANSSPVAPVAGIETFYLGMKGTKYAMDVASRENASFEKSVFDLPDLVEQIAKNEKAQASTEFAECIQAALYAFAERNVPGSKDRGVKSAPFVVLIGAHMPSVLAEIGFLTNVKEESLLKRSDYRQRLAEALYRGVSRYAESLSHFQTEPAPSAPAITKTAERGGE
jgi:N-acetylmuramoyl-L-alanine amidase